MTNTQKHLGFGVGLRNNHFDHILTEQPTVDWFEAISENFMDSHGRPRWILDQIAERYPIVLHGVSLSIGSTDPLNKTYLNKLKKLADDIQAHWVSDHLCWTGVLGHNSHDLLPLPLNEQTLEHLIPRIQHVQDHLERPLVLENPSSYAQFIDSTMSEPDFLRALCDNTGCQLLLDVNNVYVTCFNAGLNPLEYLKSFPFESVVQIHLAGHQHCDTHIIDTHDQPVTSDVWDLFMLVWRATQGVATLLEWDGNVPDFATVHNEVLKAKTWVNQGIRPSQPANTTSHHSATSTPVDFLMPSVNQGSVVSQHLNNEAQL